MVLAAYITLCHQEVVVVDDGDDDAEDANTLAYALGLEIVV